MIPVTKPYLPNREKLNQYIDGIYERNWLTNNGPLVQELTQRLESYLGVENLLLVSNGTLALQVAYHALGITAADKPEAITTPFTFIATANSLKWQGVEPVFADIDADTWCLEPAKIEDKITANTKAIVPVHVFGNACDVEAIDTIAQKHNLKVIYDAAHAFGVTFKDKSLLTYGDAATLSFHATKLFHSIEGGAIVFKHKEDLERAKKAINFGIVGPEEIDSLGINAKMNEFQAAMGLCVLDELENNLSSRSAVWNTYAEALGTQFQLQKIHPGVQYNYAYFPVVFDTAEQATQVLNALKENDVIARRYFYPSLDTVDYFQIEKHQPLSKDIANRILCLPIYSGINKEQLNKIIYLVNSSTINVKTNKISTEKLCKYLNTIDADFSPKLSSRIELYELAEKINKLGYYHYIYDNNNNISAFLSYYLNDEYAYINIVHVDPISRGKGLGNKILESMILATKNSKCKLIKLEVSKSNTAALKLYKSFGFIESKIKNAHKTKVYLEKHL